MKNKIICSLLAALMIVVAIPFATLPASAELAMQTVAASALLPSDGRFESLHNPDNSVGNWVSYGYSVTADCFDGEEVIKIAVNGEAFEGIAIKDATDVKSWGFMPANLYRYDAMKDVDGNTVKAVNANYIAVDYYYDTANRADESESGRSSLEGLNMVWCQNGLTSGTDTYEVKKSTNKIVADEWATIYIPVNYSDKAANENDALSQFAFHPFGKTYGNPQMYTGDALYIKELRFTSYDPESFELSTRFIDYYLTEADYEYGECYDSYEEMDLSTITLIDIAEEDIPDGKIFGGWKDMSTGEFYSPGDSYTLTSGDDVSFVAVWTSNYAYYSADGEIDGISGVHSNFAEAIQSVVEGGKIFVEGTLNIPSGGVGISKNITIEGYDESAQITTLYADVKIWSNGSTVKIDNIKFVRMSSSEGESALSVVNGKLIIGEGVTYQSGIAPAGAWNAGAAVHPNFGIPTEADDGNQAYIFNSEDFHVESIAPTVNFNTEEKTQTGDFYTEINAGAFNNVYGISSDGNSGIRIHDGDTKYVINGGTVGKIYTAASKHGKTTGDIFFEINGGNIGGIVLGHRAYHSGNSATVNTYVTINIADLVEGGYSVPSITDGEASVSSGDTVLLYNNVEDLPEDVSLSTPVNVTKFIKVSGGKLTINDDGTFKAYADDIASAGTLYANGIALTPDSNGNYTIDGTYISVNFDNGSSRGVSFDGTVDMYAIGSYITLPKGAEDSNSIFAAWLYDGRYYSAGEGFEVPEGEGVIEFISVTAPIVNGEITLYVDQQNGNDINSGIIPQLPVKTLSRAANIYMEKYLSYSPVVYIVGTYEGDTLFLPYANNLTYTGGTLVYNSAFVVNMPTKFRDITLKALTPFKYIEIGANNVQFLGGVKKAEGSEALSIHFGPSSAYSPEKLSNKDDYSLTINSGDFTTVFAGPNYLDNSAPTFFSNAFNINLGGNAVVHTIQISDGHGNYSNKCTIDNNIVVTVKDNASLSKASAMNRFCAYADGLLVHNYTDNPVRHVTYSSYPDAASVYIYNISGFKPTLSLVNPPSIWYDGDFYVVSDGSIIRSNKGNVTVPSVGAYDVCGGKTVLDTLKVLGAQIRVTGEQALRFIANYDYSLDDIYTPEEFGFVVLPAAILGEAELKADAVYSFNGAEQRPGVVPARRLYSEDSQSKQYTVCITGLNTEAKLSRDYTVRAYIKVNGEYIYGEQYSTSVRDIENAALDVKYAISELHNKYNKGRLTDEELADRIDTISKNQIDIIVNAESQYPTSGRVFYVSNNGNDSRNGTSPATAWKTYANLTSDKLRSGDTVLFERGGTWRGTIKCVAGVTYSAYGEGAKPTILGSERNYADPSLWKETAAPCVYEYTGTITAPGIIVFNASDEYGNYNEIVGTLDGFVDYSNLDSDLEFAPIITNGKLYLYSFYGNPGERFDSIEIGPRGRVFNVDDADNVTIDNFRIRFNGGHGVGTDGAKNLTVRNCVIDYVGGSKMTNHTHETTRYGNAIESYGGCDGFYVYDNWCYQIFDTGITHQYNVDTIDKHDCTMDDVYYSGNVIEYCHWGFEWYNYDYETTQQYVKNVNITDNICRMIGYGWGSRGGAYREASIATLCSWGLTPDTEDFVIANNVFDRSMGKLFFIGDIYEDGTDGNMLVEYADNIYVQGTGDLLGTIFGEEYNYNELTPDVIEDIFGDTTSVFSYNNDSSKENYTPNIK